MTALRFDGKVALVTGAGGGLGRQHALLLASRGARVVVNDFGGSVTGEGADDGPAQTVAAEIIRGGGEAVADLHSVATREGGAAAVRTAVDSFGRLDILVNNAGILRDVAFDEMTDDHLDPLLDVHLRGAFWVTRPAWHAMREQGYGRVINTTSASGLFGSPRQSNYGTVKAGLLGFTRVLAAEGAEHNIKVNAVAPAAFTRMVTYGLEGFAHEPETADQIAKAFSEALDPASVSPVVALLAHEKCPVTGEVYSVGGGQVSRIFIGRTPGYFHRQLTVEDVLDHIDEIRDEGGYTVPANSLEEMATLFGTVEMHRRQSP